MAVTRKLLKGMNLTEEQIDTIIDAHTEVVDGLKEQISQYKADAEELKNVKEQLVSAQKELESSDKDSYKVKYDALKEEYDAYKNEQTEKETHQAKESAYRDVLKEVGISEKRIPAVLKVSDIDAVSLDKDGKIKDVDALKKNIEDEWSDFITTTEQKGAEVPTPPESKGGSKDAYDKMSLSDKMKYANEHPQEVAEWTKKG